MSRRRALAVTCCILIVAGACSPALSTIHAEDQPAVPDTAYRVYNAMLDLMQFPKKDLHMLIADTTLNFRCGEDSGTPVLMNGCSGMRLPPSEPGDIMQLLQKSWPDMETATWENFLEQNADSAKLHDAFSTSWKHKVADLKDSRTGEWASPDLVVFFSSVGFNMKRTEAVVYCLTFSYMDNVPTEGDYFLFRADNGEWKPKGRVTYIQFDSSSDNRAVAMLTQNRFAILPAALRRPETSFPFCRT